MIHQQFDSNRPRNNNERIVRLKPNQARCGWVAAAVPEDWAHNRHGRVTKLVVNLPRGVRGQDGQLWRVRRQRSGRQFQGISFAEAIQEVTTPAGLPADIKLGEKLVVSGDVWGAGGVIVESSGLVLDAAISRLPTGEQRLQLVFEKLKHETLRGRRDGRLNLDEHELEINDLRRTEDGSLRGFRYGQPVLIYQP